LYAFLLEPYFKLLDELPSHHLIFARSEKGELKAFLDYLEIFINEIRKFEIACGEYEVEGMANIPSNNLRRERRHFLTSNNNNNPNSPMASPFCVFSPDVGTRRASEFPIKEEANEEDENEELHHEVEEE